MNCAQLVLLLGVMIAFTLATVEAVPLAVILFVQKVLYILYSNLLSKQWQTPILGNIVCPKSVDYFSVVICYMHMGKTSWTYSKH